MGRIWSILSGVTVVGGPFDVVGKSDSPGHLNAVRAVARYSHAPKEVHWKAALHMMILDVRVALIFLFSERYGVWCHLELCVDLYYASKATDRRSVSSGVVMCTGACVLFHSRRQKSVKLSSTKEGVCCDG